MHYYSKLVHSIVNNLTMKDKKASGNHLSRKGHVAVYVGKGKKRYELPVKYLSHPTIQELMVQSQHGDLEPKIEGPIVLACGTQFFDRLLLSFKEHHRS
ncbi:hypothetical protein SO802_031228 [Lithocarpus litseifolius]|uniref:Uncharacterized protein n=1 Tax=Lithocarpus litseifolius TaxID=425828 RepID=A0AAW2BKG9_9ROSI